MKPEYSPHKTIYAVCTTKCLIAIGHKGAGPRSSDNRVKGEAVANPNGLSQLKTQRW